MQHHVSYESFHVTLGIPQVDSSVPCSWARLYVEVRYIEYVNTRTHVKKEANKEM